MHSLSRLFFIRFPQRHQQLVIFHISATHDALLPVFYRPRCANLLRAKTSIGTFYDRLLCTCVCLCVFCLGLPSRKNNKRSQSAPVVEVQISRTGYMQIYERYGRDYIGVSSSFNASDTYTIYIWYIWYAWIAYMRSIPGAAVKLGHRYFMK